MSLSELSEPLPISSVEFRVQSINNGGYATILAYKNARVDMDRLDKVCGVGFWQRKHEFKNDKLYCSVGVWNKTLEQWVWVEDVGNESNADADKGHASDAFKRACFNLGIGRELYDYPIISIKLNPNEIQERNGKKYASWNFKLKEWRWYAEFSNGKISFLAAQDNNNQTRFKWGEMKRKVEDNG